MANGVLDIDAPVERYVPELWGSAFQGATLCQLLDMRVGLALNGVLRSPPSRPGRCNTARRVIGTRWIPARWPPICMPSCRTLTATSRAAWRRLELCLALPPTCSVGSSNARQGGVMPIYFPDLLWMKLGAARPCYITVDRLGAPRCAGGMCMTAMDLARVGQLLVEGGRRGARPIVPKAWIDDITTAGDPDAWLAASFVPYFPGRSMHYRAKWYVERGAEPVLSGFGIHRQHLVDRARQIVMVKLSSQARRWMVTRSA